MKNRIIELFAVFCSMSAAVAAPAPGSNAAKVIEKMKAVAESPTYYWSWTHAYAGISPWHMRGDTTYAVKKDDGFAPMSTADVKLTSKYQKYADGKRPVINYADLGTVTGTWYPPQFYAANRASLTAVIKRQWQELGGVMVFSWHMDHPYCTNGFRRGSYRYKSSGEDRNVIRQILDGTGRQCGTGRIDGKGNGRPFANPRDWYMASLKEIADFFNGFVDDETGKKIPVIMRYGHEMDGTWFWWGRGWCSSAEFREFSRMTADYLRKACGEDQIIFAYTPDKTWKEFGKEGDSDNTFLAYYPGDKYVDLIGLDDYTIGHGGDKKAELALAETVRKLRLMSAFAKERGLVAALTETGGEKKRDDFWVYLHRIMTAEGVHCAFADTWGGKYGTVPDTPASEQDELAFSRRPEVLMEGSNAGFR